MNARGGKAMNFIGSVIKIHRERIGISRRQLSDNMCSEKYIYLIETGARTPSAEMTKLIGNRLGIDLFDYFEYLDCENPVEVHNAMSESIRYRQRGDFVTACNIIDQVSCLSDFKQKPWCYEVEINKANHLTFIERKYEDSIKIVLQLIDKMESRYKTDLYMSNVYVLLTTNYMLTGRLVEAKATIQLAEKLIYHKEPNLRYSVHIVSVKISSMIVKYELGKYEEVIAAAEDLLEYNSCYSSCERLFYGYFYLAFANYKLNRMEKVLPWFKKGIYALIIKDRPLDVYYLIEEPLFKALLECGQIGTEIVGDFTQKYHLEERIETLNRQRA